MKTARHPLIILFILIVLFFIVACVFL